jgi:NodT family efflux transporter outer membrane factor (OMF) lipoprotein
MRVINTSIVLLLALLLLSGCAVGPNYHRPSAPTAPTFKEAPPEGWKSAQPSEAVDRGKWWDIYNDPELARLEEQVSISNQNIKVFEAQYRQARDAIRISRAGLFPTVSATPSITTARSSATLSQRNLVNFISGSRTEYSLPLDASYTVDLWGSIRRSITAARATAQVSAADLANARLTYESQLAQFYFQLRGLDSQEDLLKRTVAAYQQNLDLTKIRAEVGVVAESDVLQARTQLSTAQAELVDVGVQRTQFEHAIAVLTGVPPAQLTLAASLLTAVPPPVPVALPSELLERRPDIASAERQAAAANEQIGIAKAAYFPTLSLSATAGFQTTSPGSLFTWPSRFWTAGPQLAQLIFDGGRRRAQVDLEQAAYDATAATYRQTVLTAFQQVEDNLSALRILEQEAKAQEQAVRDAAETLDITMDQYKAGTANYLQVVVAQASLFQNQQTAIDVQTRRMVASVALVEALGGGWNTFQLPR